MEPGTWKVFLSMCQIEIDFPARQGEKPPQNAVAAVEAGVGSDWTRGNYGVAISRQFQGTERWAADYIPKSLQRN